MNEIPLITQDDVVKLQEFHAQHFVHQPIPPIRPTANAESAVDASTPSADLGFYSDGVRRTLTDEQIAMFRHSEIQRLLAERRRQKEREEEQREKQERVRRRAEQKLEVSEQTSRFDNDTTVHASGDVQELSYDDSAQASAQPKTFQWPVLGQ